MDLTEAVIARTRRVPLPPRVPGDGAAVTRQLDAALLSAGVKLSRGLFEELASRETGQVFETGRAALAVARQLAGDHVRHNPYFRDFPFNVPATLEFWADLIERALVSHAPIEGIVVRTAAGVETLCVNLLSLPGYGTVQHTFEDMLAAHEALAAAAGDRVTLLHPGGSPADEADALYAELAGSRVPLAGEDLVLLERLAAECGARVLLDSIPVRENRAVVNRIALNRIAPGDRRPLLIDTATDVLRLAAAASDGDVTLEQPTRFRSFTRAERRALLAALDLVITGSPAKLADVARYAEQWKRVGERLHPHDYGQFPQAQRVFAVARGDERAAPSLAAKAEASFRAGVTTEAARRLAAAPGLFFRSLDRLLRSASPADAKVIVDLAAAQTDQVSGRVLLSVREHFQNRSASPGRAEANSGLPRIFTNRAGRAWVTPETRPGLDPGLRGDVLAALDEAITGRLPRCSRLVVDRAVLGVALPLSGKPAAPGLGVLPRGSVSDVVPGDQDVLSFFVYWRQREQRTDYDLSALLTDREFTRSDFVSWQMYHSADAAAVYSGDITDAPEGATEFISCDLSRMSLPVVIPQVLVYGGEGYDETAEAFFGYMTRSSEQKGAPFEAATVRMKSDLRGSGRVAFPLAFIRGEDGRWRAKWLHLYLKGARTMNIVQQHKPSTGLLTRTVLEREYLRVEYLAGLMAKRTADGAVRVVSAGATELAEVLADAPGPVTYVGLDRPDGLPADAQVFTRENLAGLIPA